MAEGLSLTLFGRVDKVIPPLGKGVSVAQITITGAEELYREIRIPNRFRDGEGNEDTLQQGTEVELTITLRPAR